MFVLPLEDNERSTHLHSIEELAREFHRTTDEVSQLYTSVLADIQKVARVRIFLHIIVSRKVKELMRQ